MTTLNRDGSNLADWLGWEVVQTDPAVEAFSFRWRDEKTEKWHSREATDLEVRQYDQVRALALANGTHLDPLRALGQKGVAGEIRELLVSEVKRTRVIDTTYGRAQRHGAVLALNAVLHLLGEPQVPVKILDEERLSESETVPGSGTPFLVVKAQNVTRALRYWAEQRGDPRHPAGAARDRQDGELNGLNMAYAVVNALVRGDNPYSAEALGRIDVPSPDTAPQPRREGR